jgi:hypothetical protein
MCRGKRSRLRAGRTDEIIRHRRRSDVNQP